MSSKCIDTCGSSECLRLGCELHAAKEAEKWMMECERLKSELLHRDVTVLPEKDAEYERLKYSTELMIQKQHGIIKELYNVARRYESKHQGLYEWELHYLALAKELLE